MIHFAKDGTATVSFTLETPSSSQARKLVSLSLEEYLVLVRTTNSMEELRVAVLDYERRKARAANA